MRIKLHFKLTFIFCLAAVVGLLTGYFFLSSHLKNYLENNIQSNLKNQTMLVKDFLETHWEGKSGFHDADLLADRFGKELSVRITIIGRNGTVAGDTDLSADEIRLAENHLSRPEIRDALENGFGISKRYSGTIKTYLFYMAVPFGKNQTAGFLRLAIPLKDIELVLSKLKNIVAAALFLVFLLSLGFTFFISVFISKPLVEMAGIAQTIAGGDFSKKPSIRSKDELGDLAKTLALMSDKIQENIQKIKQDAAKSNAILSCMVEGIIVTDEKGKILLINPALMKLFSLDKDPSGKKPIEILRNVSVQDIVETVLKGGNFTSEEITVIGEKTLHVNAAPILRDNQMDGIVLVFHDITELKRLENVRRDFVANASHELRTPISSIKGYAETLLDGALGDKKNAKDFVNIIHEDSNRLAKLIDDLLDLAKIESGKMATEFLPVNIPDIIKKSVNVVNNRAKVKSITIDSNAPNDLPPALADETLLSQVLFNLLDNAVKYTPEKGSVKIDSRKEGELIQIDISDTGIGIPEKDIPRIFERFYRVDKARSRELGGTGLGLSIVKHIIQILGGSVWVKSELGKGSTFSFTVPI